MELTFLPRPIAVPVSTFGGRRIGRAELPRSGAPFLDAKTIAARGLGSAGSAAAATLGTLWVAGVRRRRRCKTWRHATDEEDFDYGAGKDYWDKRYQNEIGNTYDWLGGYEKFQEYIEKATVDLPEPKTARILDLGCGNARLSEDMYDNGFKEITGLDISDVAIDSMRVRNAEKRPDIEWVVGDAFNLPFEDESFDLVIDKSTTDAVSCDKDHIHENMTKMYGEVQRVLKKGGTFLVFSAVEHVPRTGLRLPHLSFEIEEKELYLPFASLWAFVSVKTQRPALSNEEALRQAQMADLQMIQERKRQQEAEERLKSTASFGVLD